MKDGNLRVKKIANVLENLESQDAAELYAKVAIHYQNRADLIMQKRTNRKRAMDYFRISADMDDLSEKLRGVSRIKDGVLVESLLDKLVDLDSETASKVYEETSQHYESMAEEMTLNDAQRYLARYYFQISADMHDISERFKDLKKN